jgi:hypothetical protein
MPFYAKELITKTTLIVILLFVFDHEIIKRKGVVIMGFLGILLFVLTIVIFMYTLWFITMARINCFEEINRLTLSVKKHVDEATREIN